MQFTTRLSALAVVCLILGVFGAAQIISGQQVVVSASGPEGGTVQLANPSKTTPGTASTWVLYNMTGGYGNSLQFWAYDTIGCATGGMCTPRFTLMDNGNVGIGTNRPVAKLEISAGQDGQAAPVTALRIDGPNSPADGTSNGAQDIAWSFRAAGSAKIRAYRDGNWGTYLQFMTNHTDQGSDSPQVRMTITPTGNIAIGSGGSITFADGTTQNTAWSGSVCGGDYAESIDVSGDRSQYEPGDVLRIDADNPARFLKAAEPYSPAVAGVYSTKPGVVGRRQKTPKSSEEVPLALIGIVPVKVTAENGPIHPYDLLVSSSTPGYAMKGTDRSRMFGAVIGKAMGLLESGTGTIEVLVSLQ